MTISQYLNRVVNPSLLRDALYYTRADSGASAVEAKGVIIGLVSGMMAQGLVYNQCILIIAKNMPMYYRQAALPDAWAHDINKAVNALRGTPQTH
jgi:hypothetical protein